MKTLSIALVVLAATLTLAVPSFSEEARRIKLLLAGNPDAGLVDIETSELGIGETRTFSSENGHPVLVTRTGDGLEIDVDGKKTVVELPPASGEGFEFHTFEDGKGADGKPRQRVIVKRMDGPGKGDGDGKFVFHGGHDGAHVAIHGEPGEGGKEVRIIRLGGEGKGAPGEAKKVHVVMKGDADLAHARAKLISSGALEGLDAATRERILAALGGERN